jgi:hypothetical protein
VAIAWVKDLGIATASANSATVTLTLTGSVPAGHCVIVNAILPATNGFTGVADSKGNTYALQIAGGPGASHSEASYASIISTALAAGDTITVTAAVATAQPAMSAHQFSGVSGLRDGVNVTNTATAATFDTLTGAAPGGEHLIIALVGMTGARTASQSGGIGTWTPLSSPTAQASFPRTIQTFYQIAPNGGYYQATGTMSASNQYATLAYSLGSGGATVLATETWTGTNGTTWPAQWGLWNGTHTIQSNAGQQVAASAATAEAYITAGPPTTNWDITVSLKANNLLGWAGISVGISDSDYFVYPGYTMKIRFTQSTGNIALSTMTAAGVETERATATETPIANTNYIVRFQRLNTGVISGKMWQASIAEPAAWDFQWTDTSNFGPGRLQLSAYGASGATTMTWDDLTFKDSPFTTYSSAVAAAGVGSASLSGITAPGVLSALSAAAKASAVAQASPTSAVTSKAAATATLTGFLTHTVTAVSAAARGTMTAGYIELATSMAASAKAAATITVLRTAIATVTARGVGTAIAVRGPSLVFGVAGVRANAFAMIFETMALWQGTGVVSNVYLGSTRVKLVFLGTKQVWP